MNTLRVARFLYSINVTVQVDDLYLAVGYYPSVVFSIVILFHSVSSVILGPLCGDCDLCGVGPTT